jgi:citrate lyase synthetase
MNKIKRSAIDLIALLSNQIKKIATMVVTTNPIVTGFRFLIIYSFNSDLTSCRE